LIIAVFSFSSAFGQLLAIKEVLVRQ